MYAHFGLTLLTIGILLQNSYAYESTAQRIVEIGSELGLHITSVIMSLFMNSAYNAE